MQYKQWDTWTIEGQAVRTAAERLFMGRIGGVAPDQSGNMSQDASQDPTQELPELSGAEVLVSPPSDASEPDDGRFGVGEAAGQTATADASQAAAQVPGDVAVAATASPSDESAEGHDETAPAQADEGESRDGPTTVVARMVSGLQIALRERLANRSLPPSPRTMRLIVGTCSALLLLALLPALLNASHHNAGAVSAPPTATAVPTATPLPSPTAMPGYQPLVDSADGFVIQYPLTWTCSSSNPGVDCIDSPTEQNYRVQVQLPGSWTGADTGHNAGDASVWVDYALSAFSNVPGRTYQRLSDANRSVAFGGVTWSSGAALVGIEPDGSNGSADATATPTPPLVLIRVQVYATLYNNHPYIIALYAAKDQFSSGMSRYFQPMLNSFAFLPDDSAS